jgi:dTDP-4-dehydrorhamnose reductase
MAAAQLPAKVEDIATANYPTPARRPANSRLDCSALARDFGIPRPDWRAGLAAVLADPALSPQG